MIRDNRVFYRQTNHDVNITIDCLDKLDTYDKWILMSGDGDFIELCKYLRKRGKQVEIWSFKECLNKDIDRYADKISYIDKEFFLKIPKISVFGFNLFEDFYSGKIISGFCNSTTMSDIIDIINEIIN